MTVDPYLAAALTIGVACVWPAWMADRRRTQAARRSVAAAREAGRHEPTTLRPWIDPSRCCGSALCVSACPEGDVLTVAAGVAVVADAAACVGHGACVSACPTGAVELVFGSPGRTVELPDVGPDFQTNVPGVYAAGELGGMGLIANAVEQGVEAASRLATDRPLRPRGGVDLVVVGAGPAGIAAGLEAIRRGLTVEVWDQATLGGAIRSYPRNKIVTTRGFRFPGRARVRRGTVSKEELVAEVEAAVADARLVVRSGEQVVGVEALDAGLAVSARSGRRRVAARVLLAVGRRGSPRRLGVPGEDSSRVWYALPEPERLAGQRVVVIGGGDAGVEAACALAALAGPPPVLAVRDAAVNQPRAINRRRLASMVAEGRVELLLEAEARAVTPDGVRFDVRGEEHVVPAGAVVVQIGGTLPTALLHACGVTTRTHRGERGSVGAPRPA